MVQHHESGTKEQIVTIFNISTDTELIALIRPTG